MIGSAATMALGSRLQVVVSDAARLDAAEPEVVALFDAIDVAASRFRDDSDISRVNAGAGRVVEVSELACAAISVAIDVARDTDGVVDPTVGMAMLSIGYDRDFAGVEGRGGAGRPSLVSGWRTVEVDTARRTVRIPAGCHLDLGATAKAFAADRAAAAAAALAGCGVLVNAGGDIAVAGEAPDGGWPVHVTDDHNAPFDAPGQTVAISSGGLATSSTTVRRWHRGSGAAAHHIVDPRTGEPAAVVWRTVSVAGASCVAANAASTAAIVLGDAAVTWLERRGATARLVTPDGRVVRTGGWPAAGDIA